MRRSWIGGGLLLVLFIAGLLVTHAMVAIHQPIEEDLTAAGEAALAGDWDRAMALYAQARDHWERHEVFRECFADHNPTEQIDYDFAQLEVYAQTLQQAAFAATCRKTAKKAAAIGDAYKLLLQNFF